MKTTGADVCVCVCVCERERERTWEWEREQAEGTGAWLGAVVVVGAAGAQYSTSSLVADGSSFTNQTHVSCQWLKRHDWRYIKSGGLEIDPAPFCKLCVKSTDEKCFFFLSFCSLGYFKKIDLWAARRENKFLAETNVTSALKHFFEWFPYSSLYTWQYANRLKPVCIWLRSLSKSLRSPLLSGMSPWQKTEFATSPHGPLDNLHPHQPGLPSQQARQRPGEEAQVNDPRQTSPR